MDISLKEAPCMKLFRQCSKAEDARTAARAHGILLHMANYELDEGIAKELARNKGTFLFAFSDLLRESGFRRSILISKMRLALAQCRKAGVKFAACTLAKDEGEKRTAREIRAFSSVLGMTQHEIKESEEACAKFAAGTGKETKGSEAACAGGTKQQSD